MTPAAITTLAQALIDSEPMLADTTVDQVLNGTAYSRCYFTPHPLACLRVIEHLDEIDICLASLDAEWAGRVAAALHGLATHIESTRG